MNGFKTYESSTSINGLIIKNKLCVDQPNYIIDCTKELELWSGSHKKPFRERQNDLQIIYPNIDLSVLKNGGLSTYLADIMVENCIGTVGLPIGVAPNFVINGKHYVIPMCIEEPSVIAACTGISKLVAKAGGFFAKATDNIMTGQVQILDVPNIQSAIDILQCKRNELISFGNQFCLNMKERGGGVTDIIPRIVVPRFKRCLNSDKYIVVHVEINVCESMGANAVNTICEGIAPKIISLIGGRIGLRILTNLCSSRRAISKFFIPVKIMNWKGISGNIVAQRVIEASLFAEDDPFRATTNNKGIMNGIDAVAIATGQDWRALESAAHAYASKNGYYGPLASYSLDKNANGDDILVGSMELPISVGTQGGAVRTHPTYQFSHRLLGNPSSKELAQIIVSVGLAQNFAALRALAIEGIQRGHMALHSRNIAAAAGVPSDMIAEVADYMTARNEINQLTAKQYMEAHSVWIKTPRLKIDTTPTTPSTLFVELDHKNSVFDKNPISLNIAFSSFGSAPVHLVIRSGKKTHPIHDKIFGEGHNVEWLGGVYNILSRIRLIPRTAKRSNVELQLRLKLISILLNLISNQLLLSHPNKTKEFLLFVIKIKDFSKCMANIPKENKILSTGYSLILALWQLFEIQVDEWVSPSNKKLGIAMIKEQENIIFSFCERNKFNLNIKINNENITEKINSFMIIHGKRWQATMMLLCDALSMGPQMLTDERLKFIYVLGRYFEFEGAISHDISRFLSFKTESENNVYKYWLECTNKSHSDKILSEFVNIINEECAVKRAHVLSRKNIADFFDAELFLNTSKYIREYYNVPKGYQASL